MRYRPTPIFQWLRHQARLADEGGVRVAISDSFGRFTRYFRKHGLAATLRRFTQNAAPAAAPAKEAGQAKPDPFDVLHGTDTGGRISGKDIAGVSLSALYSTAYVGTPPSAFTQALAVLPIRYEDFSFVDVGCGKGRALLIAAEFAFPRLVGVELSDELCTIARSNISIALDPERASRISVVNQDATKIIYPDGPLLLFLYNPFGSPILRRVLKNLERQVQESPRPVYLLYGWDPGYKEVMESFPFLRRISVSVYPLSAEDAQANPFGRTEEHFTLYSSDTIN